MKSIKVHIPWLCIFGVSYLLYSPLINLVDYPRPFAWGVEEVHDRTSANIREPKGR
jgi:hypothetical protein